MDSGTFDHILEKYADLVLNVGLNLQEGQRLTMGAIPGRRSLQVPLDAAPLVREITGKAYQKGASYVEVYWGDQQLELLRYQNAPKDSLDELPTWSVEEYKRGIDRKDAWIGIFGHNPHVFKDVEPEVMEIVQKKRSSAFREVMEYGNQNPNNWSIIAYPTTGWASAVFPDLPLEDAVDKLWDYIIQFCRLDQPDPSAYWQNHFEQLHKRCQWLEKAEFTALHLKSPGTDLRVNLPQGHRWRSAVLQDRDGVDYVANIPSEEVFTLPDRLGVEGHLTSTKPFTMGEMYVDDMHLEFKDGKVTHATAGQGEDFLKNILEIDEGSSRLGEIALVPHSSPISQSGVQFHSVLLDENASVHIALGLGLRDCLAGGEKMDTEAFQAAGGNWSTIHYDFMVGSEKMDVDGVLPDGNTHPVMRSGEWAFEVE